MGDSGAPLSTHSYELYPPPRTVLVGITAALLIILLVRCGESEPETPGQRVLAAAGTAAEGRPLDGQSFPSSADSITWTEMRGVHLRLTSSIAVTIHYLRGRVRSLRRGQPVTFDDPDAFRFHIDSARVGISPENLANLLNDRVFAYEGAPLSQLEITLRGDQIVQSGIMHKAVDVPFEITADVEATSEGLIRLRPTAIEVLDIPAARLMNVFGLSLEEMIDLSGAEGVSASGNDLILDPEVILPPPPIQGHLASIQVEDSELVQVFRGGSGPSAPDSVFVPPDPEASHYMFFRGDTLRFGKLLMLDADMQLVDADPTDPFDFFLREYKKHLVAGYARVMPDFGLQVIMPDYDALDSDTVDAESLETPPVPRRP